MAIITIETPFNIDLEFKIAAFNKRLAAWVIDLTIICLYYYVMMGFIYPLLGMNQAISTAAGLFAIIIPVLIYQLVFELLFNGQTVGKMLAGIKIIDKEGKEPTWGQYFTRWILCLGNLFIYIVPHLIMQNVLYMIGFLFLCLPDMISILVSSKSQRIGDFAAGTVVIDKRYSPNINDTIYLQIEDRNYQPVFPQVMRLNDRDINGIRDLLHTKRRTKETENFTIEVALRIKTVLDIQSNLSPLDFLAQLLKDYNYFTSNS